MSEPSIGAVLRGAVDLSSLRGRPTGPTQATTPAPSATSGGPTSGGPTSGGPTSGGQSVPGTGATKPSLVMDVTDAMFPQVLELSRTVPVVVDLWAEWCGPCKQLSPILEKVVLELAGRVVLAKVDVDANPQLAQGFRAQSIPMVVALVAGQPVPLFTGAVPEEQVRDVFTQLLAVAARNGVAGVIPVGTGDQAQDASEEAQEPPVPPLHAEAFAAIEAGRYSDAAAAYEKALAQNPRDDEARAGLGQVRLLERVQGVDLTAARAAAAASPHDVDAQFVVADLDVSGGHVEDGFARLLDLFAELPDGERTPVRERLLELFGLVGDADPRVMTARRRLAALLF